jgi:hypothetical protein
VERQPRRDAAILNKFCQSDESIAALAHRASGSPAQPIMRSAATREAMAGAMPSPEKVT